MRIDEDAFRERYAGKADAGTEDAYEIVPITAELLSRQLEARRKSATNEQLFDLLSKSSARHVEPQVRQHLAQGRAIVIAGETQSRQPLLSHGIRVP